MYPAVLDVDVGGGYACAGTGEYGDSVLPTQFCCELKTALKIKILKKLIVWEKKQLEVRPMS